MQHRRTVPPVRQFDETSSDPTDAIAAVAFSPDSRSFATVGVGLFPRWRDVTSGRDVRIFSSADHSLFGPMAVAFTRDGSQIITDSGPNIVFWNTQNGEIANQVTTPAPIRSIAGNAVAFSPDSTLLASGSNDNTVRVWSVADGKEVLRLPHRFGVIAVAFSPDNQALASGGWENLVRIWDLADGRQIATFDHRNAIHSLAFSAAQQDLTFARPLIGGPDALGPVERWS